MVVGFGPAGDFFAGFAGSTIGAASAAGSSSSGAGSGSALGFADLAAGAALHLSTDAR